MQFGTTPRYLVPRGTALTADSFDEIRKP